jgi:hypothetical protein
MQHGSAFISASRNKTQSNRGYKEDANTLKPEVPLNYIKD